MKETYPTSPNHRPVNLVKMAQLILDYEADQDYKESDIQKGVMIDMVKMINYDPPQLLQTLPTLPVAQALFLAFERGIFSEESEIDMLATAAYYSLSRAMTENPRDMLLYKLRFSLLQGTHNHLRIKVYTAIKQAARRSLQSKPVNISYIQGYMIPEMLITDLLRSEEYFEDRVVFLTEHKILMEDLKYHKFKEVPLYKHINSGLEYHDNFNDFLHEKMQKKEIWCYDMS